MMNPAEIKKKVELLEQQLYTATLETYPRIAREYSFWAEKLNEIEKPVTKKKLSGGDDDDDDAEDDGEEMNAQDDDLDGDEANDGDDDLM